MPDESNGSTTPEPVEVRIHRSQDPQVDVSLDAGIGLPFGEASIDVSLDQQSDQPGENSHESSHARLTLASEPPSDETSKAQIIRGSEPKVVTPLEPRVDQSFSRLGQPA